MLGLILQQIGSVIEVEEIYILAFNTLKDAKDKNLQLAPLDAIASLRFTCGDLKRCEEILLQEKQICKKYNFQKDLIRLNLSLARLEFKQGDFKKAIIILSDIDYNRDIYIKNRVFQLLGMIYVLKLQNKKAHEYLNKSINYFADSNNFRAEIVCLEYFGLNEYLAGNYSKAKEYYQQILDRYKNHLTASAKAQTLRLLTDVLVAEGNIEEAIQTAKKARRAIKNVSEKIELGALYRAYGQIYTHEGDVKKAGSYFKKSINILETTGARYEKALTLLTMGRSECYSVEDQQRHLKNAKELFEDMGVEKRVEEIEKELHHPYDPIAIANSFLDLGRSSGISINRSKMQKLVYFAHGWYLAAYGVPLINEEVQYRSIGLVVPAVYERFAVYGPDPILRYGIIIDENGKSVTPKVKPDDYRAINIINKVWEVFGRYDSTELSAVMDIDSSWIEMWNKIKNRQRSVPIKDEKLREYFLGIAQKNLSYNNRAAT